MARIIKHPSQLQIHEKMVAHPPHNLIMIAYSFRDVIIKKIKGKQERVIQCPICSDKHYLILDEKLEQYNELKF